MKAIWLLTIFIALVSCGVKENSKGSKDIVSDGIDQAIAEEASYAKIGKTKLSDYGFFIGQLSDLSPSEELLPYDLNTPLFSDYASKKRFIYLPKGTKIDYEATEVLDFPVGTTLIKNFYYDGNQIEKAQRKILETRLLIHQKQGWQALPYIWNAEQTEAYLEITGGTIPIVLAGSKRVNYTIPDMNQCKSCHDSGGKMVPIGPSLRQLNRRFDGSSEFNQLTMMQRIGWLELPKGELPKIATWNDPRTGTLDRRARAYLDINCAHCHNEKGPAKNSGLNLSISETDPYKLGVNKKPVAAGRGSAQLKYGIVPGKPEASILVHRMKTIEPGTMMPELGRSLEHREGVELIEEWISEMR